VAALRNITLTLDEEILSDARVIAARQGLSVSALLRKSLTELVEHQRAYIKARESAMQRLRQGHSLGGTKPASRDELHDRGKLR
jgi:antitoxin component of RelBE/YafQ-DinJ toxin-antitoxin module